jgi:hypothetical protein
MEQSSKPGSIWRIMLSSGCAFASVKDRTITNAKEIFLIAGEFESKAKISFY